MFGLVKFLLLSNTTNGSSAIAKSVEEYFQDVYAATLFYDSIDDWHRHHFPRPVILMSLNTNKIYQQTNGFILDFRKKPWTEEKLESLRTSSENKYLIIVTNATKANVINDVKRLRFCDCRIISANDLSVWHNSNPCQGVGSAPKPEDMCQAALSYLDFPPRVIIEGSRLAGMDGSMLQAAADYFGIQLSFINRHEAGVGTLNPPTGLLGDVLNGTSLFGIGALNPLMPRYEALDILSGYVPVAWAWAVPGGVGPGGPKWYTAMIVELNPEVWVGTTINIIVFITLAICLADNYRSYMPFYILALFLGVAHEDKKHIRLSRSLTALALFLGIITTSCYKTVMSSIVTAPSSVSEIRTLEELSNSGYKFLGYEGPRQSWIAISYAYLDNKYIRKINASYTVNESMTLDEALLMMANKQKVAVFRHSHNILYFAQKVKPGKPNGLNTPCWNTFTKASGSKRALPRFRDGNNKCPKDDYKNAKTRNKIHLVEESVFKYVPRTLLLKRSCLTKYFQRVIDRLWEAGLGQKWVKDYTPDEVISETKLSPLNLDHVRGPLYLILIGWIFAFTALALEVVTFMVIQRKQPRLFVVSTSTLPRGSSTRVKLTE